MAISRDIPANATANGITSVTTLPAHNAGDFILGIAFRDGNTTPPTIPVGWNVIDNSTGANSCSIAAGYLIAASSSEVSGTWSSATTVIFAVYSGVDTSTTFAGGVTQSGGSGTTVTYGTLTMSNTTGTSWVVAFGGHRSANTSISNSGSEPTGLTLISTAEDATDEAGMFDSTAGVTSYTTNNVSVGGTSSGWRTIVLELQAAVASTGVVRHGMLMGMG